MITRAFLAFLVGALCAGSIPSVGQAQENEIDLEAVRASNSSLASSRANTSYSFSVGTMYGIRQDA